MKQGEQSRHRQSVSIKQRRGSFFLDDQATVCRPDFGDRRFNRRHEILAVGGINSQALGVDHSDALILNGIFMRLAFGLCFNFEVGIEKAFGAEEGELDRTLAGVADPWRCLLSGELSLRPNGGVASEIQLFFGVDSRWNQKCEFF